MQYRDANAKMIQMHIYYKILNLFFFLGILSLKKQKFAEDF